MKVENSFKISVFLKVFLTYMNFFMAGFFFALYMDIPKYIWIIIFVLSLPVIYVVYYIFTTRMYNRPDIIIMKPIYFMFGVFGVLMPTYYGMKTCMWWELLFAIFLAAGYITNMYISSFYRNSIEINASSKESVERNFYRHNKIFFCTLIAFTVVAAGSLFLPYGKFFKLLFKGLRYVIGLITGNGVSDSTHHIEESFESEEIDEGDPLINDTTPAAFYIFLIVMAVVTAILILYFVMGTMNEKLKRRVRERDINISAGVREEIVSIEPQKESVIKSDKPGRNNNEKIRKIFKKSIITIYDNNVDSSRTPVELMDNSAKKISNSNKENTSDNSENNVRIVDIYEKARYSGMNSTKEEVDSIKVLSKNIEKNQ